MITKFHGKFRDLIPAGFKFQKLYANNYRQYSLHEEGKEYGNCIRVWQHHGGYVEINDLFDYSYLIFKIFSDKEELKKYKSTASYYQFMINQVTGEVEVFDKDSKNYELYHFVLENKGLITAEEGEKMIEEYYRTYRKVLISENSFLFGAINKMLEMGFVKV